MKIVLITSTSALRRIPAYRFGGRIYVHSNSITGHLILAGILRRAGHTAEVYEELNAKVPIEKLWDSTDVFCFTAMTSTAPRAYELADLVHQKSKAKVLMGGMHVTVCTEEALKHADQVILGEGETVILDVVEGRITDRVVCCIPIENLDEVPFPDYSTLLKTPCKAANVISRRGCPYRYTFCTTSRMFAPTAAERGQASFALRPGR